MKLIDPAASSQRLPLLAVTEGSGDVEFLKRVSRILHAADVRVPDLEELERTGKLVFMPIGGGEIVAWSKRLDRLPNRRFHLHDRETGAEAIRRLAAVAAVERAGGVARLTSKRALENYLHAEAIVAAGGPAVRVTDRCNLSALIARARFPAAKNGDPWRQLSARTRQRFAGRVKRWLNSAVVERMTPELLARRDRRGEVRQWLATIAELLA